MSGPDFLTVDAFVRPPGGRIRWRVGVFLQARPLAATGTLGTDKPPYPKLPGANRAGI